MKLVHWPVPIIYQRVAAVTLPPNHQMTIFRHTTALYSCLLSAATGCWFHHGKSSIIQPIGHLSFIYHYLMHTKHSSHSLIRGLETGSQWHFFFLFFPAHLFIFTRGVPGCDFQKSNFTARDDSVDPCCFDWSQLIRSNWDGFSLLTKPISLDTSICAVISHFVDDFISHAIEPPTRTTK